MSIGIYKHVLTFKAKYIIIKAMRNEIISTYQSNNSYSETARIYHLSRQRIWQIVNYYKNSGRRGRLKLYKKKFKKICQKCKIAQSTVLHHIDLNNNNDIPSNLISLCNDCHQKIHGYNYFGGKWKIHEKKEYKCRSCGRGEDKAKIIVSEMLCVPCFQWESKLNNKKLFFRRYMSPNYCLICKIPFLLGKKREEACTLDVILRI